MAVGGELKVVVEVLWCGTSVPGRGLSFCSFGLFVFVFPSGCVLYFVLAFTMFQPFGNQHLGKRQECESEEAGGVQRKAASVF